MMTTWQQLFLETGTKEVGLDLSVMIPILSQIIQTERKNAAEGRNEDIKHRILKYQEFIPTTVLAGILSIFTPVNSEAPSNKRGERV